MTGRGSFISILSLMLILGFTATRGSLAQSSVAVDAGVATFGDGRDAFAVFATGVRFSSLKPNHVSADVRLATVPQALAAGAFVLAADLDAALVLPLGERVYATPRAGVSLIGGMGSGGFGGLPGLNYGFGFVARMKDPLAVRFDFTHFMPFGDLNGGVSSWSIGIAWVH